MGTGPPSSVRGTPSGVFLGCEGAAQHRTGAPPFLPPWAARLWAGIPPSLRFPLCKPDSPQSCDEDKRGCRAAEPHLSGPGVCLVCKHRLQPEIWYVRDTGIGRLLFVLSRAPLVSQRLWGCGSLPRVLPRPLLPSPCGSEFQRLPPMQGSGTPLGATLPGHPALPHPGSGLTVTPAWYIKPRFQASLSLSGWSEVFQSNHGPSLAWDNFYPPPHTPS